MMLDGAVFSSIGNENPVRAPNVIHVLHPTAREWGTIFQREDDGQFHVISRLLYPD